MTKMRVIHVNNCSRRIRVLGLKKIMNIIFMFGLLNDAPINNQACIIC